jgi:hypothetical protein
VRERTATHSLTPGALLLTRIAPDGDSDGLYGGVFPIGLHEREHFIDLLSAEPGPAEIVAAVAGRFRGPTLVTHEGQQFLAVEGTLTTTAPKRLSAALDAAFEVDEDGWLLTEPGPAGGGRILATLRLTARTLTVQTMSEARYALVMDILDGIDVPLVERSRDISDPLDESDPGDRSSARNPMSGALDPATDPQAREVMTSVIAQYERRWLDESIAALGGVTPRQAAADPTRRDDLIRLLESFPSTGSPVEMDGGRLRAALGGGTPGPGTRRRPTIVSGS